VFAVMAALIVSESLNVMRIRTDSLAFNHKIHEQEAAHLSGIYQPGEFREEVIYNSDPANSVAPAIRLYIGTRAAVNQDFTIPVRNDANNAFSKIAEKAEMFIPEDGGVPAVKIK